MPQFKAPTGELIVAVLEKVPCAAYVKDIAADGSSVTYDGSNGTTVWWDDQYPVKTADETSFIFLDESSEQFTFDQLTLVEDDEDEEEELEVEQVETLKVSPAERDIILAALRLWQDNSMIPPAVIEIAQNGRGQYLDDAAIDDLCERINLDG